MSWRCIATTVARRNIPVVQSRCSALPSFGVYVSSSSTPRTIITYSGGHASEGQGGYYGSGGARASINVETEHRPEMVALAADVENLTLVMEEIEKLDAMLEEEKESNAGKVVTGKALEISSKIKKIMTSADVMDCLNRLEVEGEPVWGLSCEERDLVYAARQKVNEC